MTAFLFFARVGLLAMIPIALLARFDAPSIVHVIVDPIITLGVVVGVDIFDKNVSISIKRK